MRAENAGELPAGIDADRQVADAQRRRHRKIAAIGVRRIAGEHAARRERRRRRAR